MNRWFRFYDEVLDDPKVQRLSPHLFKAWVNILCLTCKEDGTLPSVADIAFRLRLSENDARSCVDDLILAGLIDVMDAKGTLQPHAWAERQFQSDTSKDRTRKWREKHKKKTGDADVTSPVTGSDGNCDGTDPDPDPESEVVSITTSEQVAAREKRSEEILSDLGLGRGGAVTAEGRRKVCARLAIANAEPLVAIYEAWSGSRNAKDPDGLFISQSEKFYREAKPEVKAACQPLAPAAPVPIPPAAIPRPSSQLAARLAMRTH